MLKEENCFYHTIDVHDIHAIILRYNLIEYSDTYLKKSGSLWQYYRGEPALGENGNTIDNNYNSTKWCWESNVEIMVSLKHLSDFWRAIEMPLINCEIVLMLTWSKNCSLVNGITDQEPIFTITVTKFYFPFVTLSTQGNLQLLKQLESGFKRTINWNKCQSKLKEHKRNRYLDFLIDPTFEGVNRLFVLSFENRTV